MNELLQIRDYVDNLMDKYRNEAHTYMVEREYNKVREFAGKAEAVQEIQLKIQEVLNGYDEKETRQQ